MHFVHDFSIYLNVFNMTAGTNESKTLTKHSNVKVNLMVENLI